ncbi:MAG: AAA family ATPase [Methanoregula sp.]|jgi:hypothetical protein|uniref:AAA family ATPase n=1 Tax=Methanoregula sp. TaxID=2052170 RepID=UPI003C289A15
MNYPLRHLSVRVPWHDAGWDGTVCRAPHLNGSCVNLKTIAEGKNEIQERTIAGHSFEDLSPDQRPCCINERVTFMAPFEMVYIKKHALAKRSPKTYGHFQPTPQRYPAYSAGIIPFHWMMRDNLDYYGDLFELDVDSDREPELGYESDWTHEYQNQISLLDCFAGHLRKEESICLFYAKQVPFIEGTGRILVGVGRIKDIGSLIEYDRKGEGMRGMVWERPIQHSIRPKNRDGFLLPYYEIIKRAEVDPSLDLERYTAKAPDEHWGEFSYGSELVTHDGSIAALLSIDRALKRMESELGIATGWQQQWVHTELIRLWKVRGPYPGFGAVLTAFGFSQGLFIAHAIQQKAGENTDPWPLLDIAFQNPSKVLPKELHRDINELAPIWTRMSVERKKFLRLISRFELTAEQAKCLYDAGSRGKKHWACSDKEILENPYHIYEISRHDPERIHLLTIDRGIFPDDSVRLKHPLEEPSQLTSAVDVRRIRAFIISVLEDAASSGNTLLSFDKIVEAIRGMSVLPECPVTNDILSARSQDIFQEVSPVKIGNENGLQLKRYEKIRDLVQKQVLGRIGGQRHAISPDWRKLIDEKFGISDDPGEQRARVEKAAALKELTESRFSVLAGPAGAGKTTVLGILCKLKEINRDGLLLLAPTGKARVRMEELAGGNGGKALTIAQFLNGLGRYDGNSGRYFMSDRPKENRYGTVIVDESSMLTEDMLGALIDALAGVKRYIFVGDPAQLPPIGAGRPFVDIIARVRPANYESMFPRIANGYAELTIERRQVGTERADLCLARWFSTTAPSAGEDDVFFAGADELSHIRFVEWQKPEDFQSKLIAVLVEELKLSDENDIRGFNEKLGATKSGNYDYFNAIRDGKAGAVEAVDRWQILSPLRGNPFGVLDINRLIHEKYRKQFLNLASGPNRPIAKPMGAERIVYGDKVINVVNHRRDGRWVYPQAGALGYLANGEIGITVGPFKTGSYPKFQNVEFSSQKGFTYTFFSSDFREEGEAKLELAYALTVHKAQGSQFRLVILVLPEGHPILSRELIYTAITRHQDRVVIMHQGPRTLLKEFAAPHRSETARRMTNLLNECRMLEFPQTKGSVFLQEGLIHRTSKGLAVRSKSELLIAEALGNAGIAFEYEKPLTLGGKTRYPDFTIEDDISGRTIYWEHLGLLEREDYRQSWDKKLRWYQKHEVLPAKDGGGKAGMLVTTTESSTTGLDMGQVTALIKEAFHA